MLDPREEIRSEGLQALEEVLPGFAAAEREACDAFHGSRVGWQERKAYQRWTASVALVAAARSAQVMLAQGWNPAVDVDARESPVRTRRGEGPREAVKRLNRALEGPWEGPPGERGSRRRVGRIVLKVGPGLAVLGVRDDAFGEYQAKEAMLEMRRLSDGAAMFGAPGYDADTRERVKRICRALWWNRILRLEPREDGGVRVVEWPPGGYPEDGLRMDVDGSGQVRVRNARGHGAEQAMRWVQGGSCWGNGERLNRLFAIEREFPVTTVLRASAGEVWNSPKRWEGELALAEGEARRQVLLRTGWTGRHGSGTRINAETMEKLTRYREDLGEMINARFMLQAWWVRQPKEKLGTVVARLKAGETLARAMGVRTTPEGDVALAVAERDADALAKAIERLWALAKPRTRGAEKAVASIGLNGVIALVVADPVRWCQWLASSPEKLQEAHNVLYETVCGGRPTEKIWWGETREAKGRGQAKGITRQTAMAPGEGVLAKMLWQSLRGGKTVPKAITGLRDSLSDIGADVLGLGNERRGVRNEQAALALWTHGVRSWKAMAEIAKRMHGPGWNARWIQRKDSVDAHFLEGLGSGDAPESPVGDWEEAKQIRTHHALVVEGQAMSHCVAGRLEELVSGETLLYHVGPEAPGGATVEVAVPGDSGGGFQLLEIQGFGNKGLEEWSRMVADDLIERLQGWWNGSDADAADRRRWRDERDQRMAHVEEAARKQRERQESEYREHMWPGLYEEVLPASMAPPGWTDRTQRRNA